MVNCLSIPIPSRINSAYLRLAEKITSLPVPVQPQTLLLWFISSLLIAKHRKYNFSKDGHPLWIKLLIFKWQTYIFCCLEITTKTKLKRQINFSLYSKKCQGNSMHLLSSYDYVRISIILSSKNLINLTWAVNIIKNNRVDTKPHFGAKYPTLAAPDLFKTELSKPVRPHSRCGHDLLKYSSNIFFSVTLVTLFVLPFNYFYENHYNHA